MSDPSRKSHFDSELSQAVTADLLALLESLPDGVLVLNRVWQIVYANAEGRRISRLPEGELPQEDHWQIYPQAVGTEIERAYREAMETGVASRIEVPYEPFRIWVDIRLLPVAGGLMLHYRDVTSQREAEQSWAATLKKLDQVFEASPDSIVCLDRQWNCTYANGMATKLLQRNPVGLNAWKDLPGNLEEPFFSNYWATMVQRTPTEFEAYYADPLHIWFKVLARPFDEGIIIFSRDVTASKRADAERVATARQLEQVFDLTSDGIFSLDRSWKVAFLNRRAEDILSRVGGLLGRNFWEAYPELVGTDFDRQYRQTMETGAPAEFEAWSPVSSRWIAAEARASGDGIVVFFRDITEARRSAELVREQQDLLAVVQRAARAATFNIDLQTEAVTYGPGSFEVYGRPLAELMQVDDFKKVRVPRHNRPVAEAVARAVKTLEPVTVEFEVLDCQGTAIWVESRFQAVAEDGMVRHLRGIAIDIDERKKAEATLVASEARYRALIELNPQALWTTGAGGGVNYANQGFLDYIGLTLESLSGLEWRNAIEPADIESMIANWRHSIQTGEQFDTQARLRRASDGMYRWWNLRAKPVRDEDGAILYWLGVGSDLHDLKSQAEALQRQQEETERQRRELESVYQTAPIGLALFDPVEFRYLRLNEQQAEIVGLPREEILGKTLTEIAPIEGLREMFEEAAAGHPIRNRLLEGALATSPTEHRYWTVNYFPVYGPDGTVQAITAASLEVTNQKRAESALIQSEKLAAVGRLASSISHEINNPLEAVTNLLYLVNSSCDLPSEVKTYVQMAQSELSRVSQIATQTLRFHRQAVSETLVTAEELIGAVLNLYQGRLTNSNIKVKPRYCTSTPILCFENDIRQVLNNLIANAIDAMRSGGRLETRAHEVVDTLSGLRGVRMSIADTGHGMTREVMARVFEPFYTTKDLNGTGLGLWISAGIVQRHHGRLQVRSSTHPIHHGTVFTLFLPLEGAGE